MASLMIHQAIGEEYCRLHRIKDVKSFLLGNLAPDLVKDKSLTHYSRIRIGNKTYTESIMNKVNLSESCKHLDITNEYQRGMFLHLVTDHAFFLQYLLNNPKYKAIENQDQLVIRDTLYRDYHRINNWIMKHYTNIDISALPENTKITRDDDMEILSIDDIQRLICFCTHIDLDIIYNAANQMQEHEM